MAAAIVLNADTLEGQLLELVNAIQILERDPNKNDTNANNVTGTVNTDNTLFNGTFSLPTLPSINAQGQVCFAAVPYLTD